MKIDDFKNGQDNLRNKKREHFDQNKHIKKAITEFFGVNHLIIYYLKIYLKDLRNKIDMKEKEIIKATDVSLDNNIKEIDGEITVIENNITQLFTELDNINNHLNAKDEVKILKLQNNKVSDIGSLIEFLCKPRKKYREKFIYSRNNLAKIGGAEFV